MPGWPEDRKTFVSRWPRLQKLTSLPAGIWRRSGKALWFARKWNCTERKGFGEQVRWYFFPACSICWVRRRLGWCGAWSGLEIAWRLIVRPLDDANEDFEWSITGGLWIQAIRNLGGFCFIHLNASVCSRTMRFGVLSYRVECVHALLFIAIKFITSGLSVRFRRVIALACSCYKGLWPVAW